ncbi:MAG: hypothetical protein Q8920_00930 [Bacillota bacterium]|nr:hypothetical protein [Bacillota bacterium]
MLFILIIAPLLLISANHNVFFVLVAIVLFINSIRCILKLFIGTSKNQNEIEDEGMDDLEDMLSVDIKRFGTGTKVVRNLIAVLFFIYCIYYIHAYIFKIMTTFIITSWIITIIKDLSGDEKTSQMKFTTVLKSIYLFVIHASSILLISLVALSKFHNIFS